MSFLTPDFVRTWLAELGALCARRRAAEQAAEQLRATQTAATETAYANQRQAIQDTCNTCARRVEAEYGALQNRLTAAYEEQHAEAERAYTFSRRDTSKAFAEKLARAEAQFRRSRNEIQGQTEKAEAAAAERRLRVQRHVASRNQKLADLKESVDRRLRAAKFGDLLPELESGTVPRAATEADKAAQIDEWVATAQAIHDRLCALRGPRVFQGHKFFWLFTFVWIASAYGLALPLGFLWGPAAGSVVAAVATIPANFWLYRRVRRELTALLEPLVRDCAAAAAVGERLVASAKERFDREVAEAREQCERATAAAETAFAVHRRQIAAERDRELERIDNTHHRRLAHLRMRYERDRRAAQLKYPRWLEEVERAHRRGLAATEAVYRQRKADVERQYAATWDELAQKWRHELDGLFGALRGLESVCDRLFPDWSRLTERSKFPAALPTALRIGRFAVDRRRIAGAAPDDPRLANRHPLEFAVPALIGFPQRASMVLTAPPADREACEGALQAIMLRLLTGLPPGRVRFTILDPIGRGKSFAPFMHLADFDALLVNHRIWTETQQIDERLVELTEHMETVIQKYLRSEFETLEAYNEQAGEIAEPYRVLVVANFPANFSDAAAQRLLSLLTSGARCGVYVLMSVDTDQPLPGGLQPADLAHCTTQVAWRAGRSAWCEEPFTTLPLVLDAPPSAELFLALMQSVGQAALDAGKVEVPFERITPPPEEWWTFDSRSGVRVSLGPAGATRQQFLDLGRGTSQHVLLAGKTGSGKSSLLHALITNLALHYSPDEVELYLIDFKKGVEFKTYAQHALPHAKVVAIESEREFGLSVMQRLDAELKLRGERFRERGVQDLPAFRNAAPSERMPRVLFIVDEFQEFFVEDDRLAQDAALLLDRLVRQGRAFGVHVLLGSQTLGGAYTLARSTVGQMAVRIALQCSDVDAHLILSDDNYAARLLTRPGEAIYNDANGMVEGNHPFQVAWLPDEKREQYLLHVQSLAEQCQWQPPAPQVVFEGNRPAEIERNRRLDQLANAPDWPAAGQPLVAWLGEAVAITEPTCATFERQSGANLLVIGQNDLAAAGVMAAALASLATQHSAAPGQRALAASFYLLDGSPPESKHAGALAGVAGRLPHRVRLGDRKNAAELLAEIAAELERRLDASETDEAVYLFIHDIGRFRNLRRKEDDFGFSRSAEAPAPEQQLAEILREGPAVGIHTIVWCDGLNNLQRTFDRQSLQEFELRVLFQMSAADSTHLIDTPAASKLGPFRAYYYAVEAERLEKFRPYGLPTDQWLSALAANLHRRAGKAAVGESSR